MIVKIREIIRDCIIFGMHFIYTRIYQMNIDKSAKLSFGAKLDKSNPKGVHIGEESFIASGAVILAHDFSKPAKADTYIGKRCFIDTACERANTKYCEQEYWILRWHRSSYGSAAARSRGCRQDRGMRTVVEDYNSSVSKRKNLLLGRE